MLTFIIPVRHQENSKNWEQLKKNLTETIKSVAAQNNDAWHGVIVANYGADIPDLPRKFTVHRVNFAPNAIHERKNASIEDFYEAFRIDKGRRVLSGLIHAKPTGHVMILDDDDFVSNRLSDFVVKNGEENGWYFKEGYVWQDGGSMLYRYDGFHKYCGSSHIIRADILKIPSSFTEATYEYISKTLGSHVNTNEDCASQGYQLRPLPFIGAVYRTGHSGAHSKSKGLIRQFFLNKSIFKNPIKNTMNLLRLRLIDKKIKHEFFDT